MGLISSSAVLCAIVMVARFQEASTASRGPDACSTVSCYYNSICVIDPSTDEPVCECPKDECDGAPSYPICADGVTYKSPCHVRLQMCIAQTWITVQHVGECGKQECNSWKPCPFHGRCESGTCSCEKCDDSDKRRDFDITSRHISVCGSDGVTYQSECHLRYQACTSRTDIKVAKKSSCYRRRHAEKVTKSMENHFAVWMRGSKERAVESDNDFVDFIAARHAGACPKYELQGCLRETHPRRKFLGVYTLDPRRRYLGAPVYSRMTKFSGSKQRNVYLSRYTSSRLINGSWVVGSKVGSGIGWFGIIDSSREPAFISGLWYSTSGKGDNPWRKEPLVSGRCLTGDIKNPEEECNLGDERGPLGVNWQSLTQKVPLYELRIRNKRGNETEEYRPGEKFAVEIFSNNRALRFTSVHVSMQNDVGECGLPELRKSRNKLKILCHGKVISRGGARMKRVSIKLTAPPRGCITFKAFVKSVRGEIFYDNLLTETSTPTPLSGTICHVGYKPTTEKIDVDIL